MVYHKEQGESLRFGDTMWSPDCWLPDNMTITQDQHLEYDDGTQLKTVGDSYTLTNGIVFAINRHMWANGSHVDESVVTKPNGEARIYDLTKVKQRNGLRHDLQKLVKANSE